MVAALGDGTLAIFHRNDGEFCPSTSSPSPALILFPPALTLHTLSAAQCWDLAHPHLLDLGRPHQSICCALAVGVRIWCGYRNCIHVVEPRGARIKVCVGWGDRECV